MIRMFELLVRALTPMLKTLNTTYEHPLALFKYICREYMTRRHISILDLMPKAGNSLGSVYKLPCLATVAKRHWWLAIECLVSRKQLSISINSREP